MKQGPLRQVVEARRASQPGLWPPEGHLCGLGSRCGWQRGRASPRVAGLLNLSTTDIWGLK